MGRCTQYLEYRAFSDFYGDQAGDCGPGGNEEEENLVIGLENEKVVKPKDEARRNE